MLKLPYPENLFDQGKGLNMDSKWFYKTPTMPDRFLEVVEDFMATSTKAVIRKERNQKIFDLYYRQNLTYSNIARIFGVTPQTIRNHACDIERAIRCGIIPILNNIENEKRLKKLYDDIIYGRLHQGQKFNISLYDLSKIGLLPKIVGRLFGKYCIGDIFNNIIIDKCDVYAHNYIDDRIGIYSEYTNVFDHITIHIQSLMRQKLGKYHFDELRKFINGTLGIKCDFIVNEDELILENERYGIDKISDKILRYYTIGKLVDMDIEQIKKLRYIGAVSFKRIVDIINSYGYNIGYDIEEIIASHDTIIADEFKMRIESNILSYNEKLKLQIADFCRVYNNIITPRIYSILGGMNIQTVRDIIDTPTKKFHDLSDSRRKKIIPALDYIMNKLLYINKNFDID